MFEYQGWITLSYNTYEEDFINLQEQIIILDKYITNFNNTSQFAKIINCNENYVMSLIGTLNHANGVLKEIENLLDLVRKLLPASFGIIYYRDQDGAYYNNYFIIRLAKGKLEKITDNVLSPCFPLIED